MNLRKDSASLSRFTRLLIQGATEEEALENIQDAISEYLGAVDQFVQGQEVREVSVAS